MAKKVYFRRSCLWSLLFAALFIMAWSRMNPALAEDEATSKIPYSAQELFALGQQRVFEGPDLKEVAFPLGGIGT